MKRVAVIGGGISGLSIAHCLNESFRVKVFEAESAPGGLIKCSRLKEGLYHQVGGHVFNSKRQEVLDWFWKFFDQAKEFVKTDRNAVISFEEEGFVGYPIENHVYMLNKSSIKGFIEDMMTLAKAPGQEPNNFEEFLREHFGDTLYRYYFKPYNEKIWKRDLKTVPLSWLEGKLPMPSIEEMLYNNFNHVKEYNMVHSSFYYAKNDGSQFLADRLAEGLDIAYNSAVCKISREDGQWKVDDENFDLVVFCGNVKALPEYLSGGLDISSFAGQIEELEYHGTTSVFCEIDKNPYSWIYMPSPHHKAHRIICTGNFADSNNNTERSTGTIEFTDYIAKEDILENLERIPLHPRYISHSYTKYTYPIQNRNTRELINALKEQLRKDRLFLLGRFAEWEYYNMDAAMGAAIDLSKQLLLL